MESLESIFLSDQTTHQPVRSVSLPSRIHPLSLKLKAALIRLSIWQRSSSSVSVSASLGSETLLVGLVDLTELYGCVLELLESPYVKHTLLHYLKGKLLEDSLDGSIVLLDVCEASREAIIAVREQVTNIKSVLRKKGNVEKEVKEYVSLRKKAKKEIAKHIVALKKIDTRDSSTNELVSTSVVSTTIGITISIFRHLLLFLSTIPSPLLSLARKIKNNIEVMKSLDDSFLDLETELEFVFKCLVKNRVLLLNILSSS